MTAIRSRQSRPHDAPRLRWGRRADWAVAVLVPLTIVVLGGLAGTATTDAAMDWYQGLNRPWFTPPGAAFGVAWTILYALMGIAFWRIIRIAPDSRPDSPIDTWRRPAIGLFCLQMVVNLAWNPAFFGLRSPFIGVVLIVPLLFLIALTLGAFRAVDRPAALLLVPYLAWVLYATVLAVTILLLN